MHVVFCLHMQANTNKDYRSLYGPSHDLVNESLLERFHYTSYNTLVCLFKTTFSLVKRPERQRIVEKYH